MTQARRRESKRQSQMARLRTVAPGDAFPWRYVTDGHKCTVQFANEPIELPDDVAALAMRQIPGRLELVEAAVVDAPVPARKKRRR